MRTGTADYFDSLIQSLACADIERSRINIVVDDQFIEGVFLDIDYFGFKILSHRKISDVIEPNQVRIYFLANNEYHSYCYESLSRVRKLQEGRVISVIHEPSCFMLLNNICSEERYSFNDNDLIEFCAAQFGSKALSFINARRKDILPFDVEYVMHCQHLALTRSDEIWTHSDFSALKLQFETETTSTAKFTVSEHPHLASVRGRDQQNLPPDLAKPDGGFRVGMFGWVSPSKRVDVALRAFAAALQTVPHEVGSCAEFLVVGKLPPPEHFDPVGLASSLGISHRVRFLDYVPLDQFEALIESCDLLLNLRFPSCGETSGTLERAIAAGVPTVTTAYQGFAELPTSAQVSSFWPREQVQLFRLLCQSLRGTAGLQPATRSKSRPRIADLIANAL